jgi:magnesium chelatase family protein
MMARALPGIMPPLTSDEAIEVTRIWSAAGRLIDGAGGESGAGLVVRRPVRSPHHTASSAAIIGGGIVPRPGEISLAHRGVLFLDELPEFPRAVLDTLRQPLEGGEVTIARAHSTVTLPARFMLVAAMNPTAGGDAPTSQAGVRAMERYVGRVSRPLIDRVDVHVEAPAVPWEQLRTAERGSDTAAMRAQVASARERQRGRQGRLLNSDLTGAQLDELAPLDEASEVLLGQAIRELGLSARAYDKIRRVARTIADLAGEQTLSVASVAEAVQYRLLDRSGYGAGV